MKKVLLSMLVLSAVLFGGSVKAQQLKVAVFDIDYMVQAMPDYATVDSLLQIYQTDSLGGEYDVLTTEYKRLDSTLKADSVAVPAKAKSIMDYNNKQKNDIAVKLVYWQQYAQQKLEQKRGELAQPLYQVVVAAYQKVLAAKKYNLVLKPQTYEYGFPIDNMFITVAKELKLDSLPQELISLGPDPDAQKTTPPAGGTAKPKTN